MKLYGGYNGKRMKKKESVLGNFLETAKGEIQFYLQSLKKMFVDPYDDDIDSDWIYEEDTYLEEEVIEPMHIRIIFVESSEDIEYIVNLILSGNIVLADYRILNTEQRKQFNRDLSIQLMTIGTHMTQIDEKTIICADRGVEILNFHPKKKAKIYQLNATKKR